MTPEELRDAAIKMLEELLKQIRSGDLVLGTLSSTRGYTRVFHTNGSEIFRIGGGTVGWTFTCPKMEAEEKIRLDKFLAEHPDAKVEGPGATKG